MYKFSSLVLVGTGWLSPYKTGGRGWRRVLRFGGRSNHFEGEKAVAPAAQKEVWTWLEYRLCSARGSLAEDRKESESEMHRTSWQ